MLGLRAGRDDVFIVTQAVLKIHREKFAMFFKSLYRRLHPSSEIAQGDARNADGQ